MNENTEVPPADEQGRSPEEVTPGGTSLVDVVMNKDTEAPPVDGGDRSPEDTDIPPADDPGPSADETPRSPGDTKKGSANESDPPADESDRSPVDNEELLRDEPDSDRPPAGVPPQSTSSADVVLSEQATIIAVQDEEMDVPIKCVDIKTGQEVHVFVAGRMTDPAFETFTPPDLEIPKDIPYSTSRSTNFTHFGVPSKQHKQRSNQWLTDLKKHDGDIVRANVFYGSVRSLLGQNWLRDEIIDYCAKHLGTLFCGDVSPYSTFIFPHNFVTRLRNLGHQRIEGVLDVKKGVKIAVNLSPQKNLMDYDHLIIYNNPGRLHWNVVVVFPKKKRIELFDSLTACDKTPLTAVWHFLVAYCRQTSTFEPKGWKLYHSCPGVGKQTDQYNCGLFAILYSVAIHHHNDLNKVTSDNCNRLRRHLIMHFWRSASHGQRLTQAWNKEYPVPVAPVVPVSSDQNSPRRPVPIVTQGLFSQEAPDKKPITQDTAGHDVRETTNTNQSKMVATHSELSDGFNSYEEYVNHIEELNLSRESKDNFLGKLALLKDESNPIQFRVVWNAFYEAIEDDQLMESMDYLDHLEEAGDEEPICLDSKRSADSMSDHPFLSDDEDIPSMPASKKVARLPGSKQIDTGLTDTESEDNSSVKTDNEVGSGSDGAGDQKPKAKPTVRIVQPTIDKAPRRVNVRRQGKTLPKNRNKRKPKSDIITQEDIVKRWRALELSQEIHNHNKYPVLFNNRSDFPYQIQDIVDVPEANLTHELCRLPAMCFTYQNLTDLVAERWKKHGSEYQWPVPPLNVASRHLGRQFKTREEQKEEAERRRQVKEGHEEYAKNCINELVEEKARINRRVDKQVDRLLKIHFQKHQDNKTRKISDTNAAVKEIKKSMDKEFGFSNKMNMAERREVTKMENNLTKVTKTRYQKMMKAISEIAYIRFRPAGIGADKKPYISTFDVKKANDPKCIHLINTEWIANWLSIVYFRLAKKLPNVWLHVPIGSSRADLAPFTILTDLPLKYPQGHKNLCLVKGLSSALYYMGLVQESGMLNLAAYKYEHLSLEEAYAYLQKDMKHYCPCIGIGRALSLPRSVGARSKKRRKATMTFQDLLADKSAFPTVVIPRGIDQCVNHAVCVVDDLVFDSTQPKALSLSKETFDWICGEDGCDGLHFAVRFDRSFKTKALKRKLCLH